MHTFGENGTNGFWAPAEKAWYRSLVEKVPAVLYVDAPDESSSALYISPRGESLLGYTKKQWLADPELWVKTLHPDDRERVLAEHLQAREEDGPFESEYRLVARDGSAVWVRDKATPVEGAEGWPGRRAGFLLDITERKLYEEKLKKSEERYRELVENAMEGIARISPEGGTIEHCNAVYAEILGLAPGECAGRSFFEFVDGKDEREARRQRELRLRGVGSKYEVSITAADGEEKVLLCGGYPLYGSGGAYEGAVQTITDVTDRKRQEEEIEKSEELFRTTFEAAAVGMAHLSPDGRWLRINDKLCEISGYPREELVSMTYRDLALPEDLAAGEERVRRLLDGRTGPYTVERRFVREDGFRVWVNLSVSLVRGAPASPEHLIFCVAEDVTKRKLEELVPDPLTPNEMAVLRLTSQGLSNPQVAERLAYSVHAVKLYMQNIFTKLKLKMRTRRAAVSRAVDIGLIEP